MLTFDYRKVALGGRYRQYCSITDEGPRLYHICHCDHSANPFYYARLRPEVSDFSGRYRQYHFILDKDRRMVTSDTVA